MVMMVMTPVAVGVEVVVRREEVVVGRGQRRVDEVGVIGQGRGNVWNSMSHPWYGHSASHGAMSVAVGRVEQPQGLRIVVWRLQSENGHVLPQPRFWIVRVAVGQTRELCPRARLARPRRAGTTSFIV